MNKENGAAQQFAGSPTILKQLDSKDYEYFQDLNGTGNTELDVGGAQTDGMIDVPDKGQAALKDLYRFSRKLGAEVRKKETNNTQTTQGELFIRSKWLRRFRKRFGSVATHAQYGPVLFLFAYDKDGNVDLRNSQMIALMDSSVKLGRNVKTGDGRFKCEFIVYTQKKRHIFAAKDSITRDFWIEQIRKLA